MFILWLCTYVCRSICVCALATAYTAWAIKLKFEPRSQHVIIWKCIFFFFEMFIFFGRYAHFFRFSQFHAYNTFTLISHDDWHFKLKPWTSRKRCIWLNYIDANMTSLNDVISFNVIWCLITKGSNHVLIVINK